MKVADKRPTTRSNVLLALSATVLLVGGLGSVANAAESAAPTGLATAASVFDRLDVNKDGTLSRQEFQAGYLELQRRVAVQLQLRERFNALDGNHDGAIDAREYPQLELIRTKGKTAPPLSAFDVDHNQSLSFVEYETLVRSLATQQPSPRK